ncbi:beta-carotene isomerase D27, chloroplastic-like isoform X1 [Dendrobium catenatum]|uniref:beta-carotene isomerase D27, chloroplastic-like isoform X1 n=1 Tax=Dendrobium catenatum TaxID=906689 RepID=UPI0009F70C03|nr:beta-carotene isomerase D27, chloroplastic-like isoform X1 [Dendrobium catenatum]
MEILCFPTARFSPRHPIKPPTLCSPATVLSIRCAQVATAPMGEKTQYKDGFFEKAFMGLFSRKMQKYASGGIKTNRQLWEWDYDSFVDVSKRVMMGRSRQQQQEVVREVLLSMLPPGAPAQFRKLFPPTKWAAEFNAALTVPFFHWLVGPSEVIEVEVDGMKQRSGVHIKKCRYLENSGCVGMCVNMCKIPTQDFFTNEFGLPLTMNPNFEDMSCDMLYGQTPPPFEEDPVSKQPCFASICMPNYKYLLGSLANPSTPVCHKLYN